MATGGEGEGEGEGEVEGEGEGEGERKEERQEDGEASYPRCVVCSWHDIVENGCVRGEGGDRSCEIGWRV